MRRSHPLFTSPTAAAAAIATFIVASAIPATAPLRAAAAAADPRGYGTRMALQLEQETRNVAALEGGSIRADVVVEKAGKKHIGNARVDPIRAKVGINDFRALISSSLANDTQIHRVNGAIYTLNLDGKVVNQRDVISAILTEVTFPAIDAASSKESPAIGIVLEPEITRERGGSGAALPVGAGGSSGAKGAERTSFVRATIDLPGVADASRVSKIDSITVTRKVSENPIGEMRDYQKVPGVWQVGNIVLTVPQQYAAGFVQWHEDFVIKGICDEGHEKTMTITALDQTAAPQMTLTLTNVGIVAVTPQPFESNAADRAAQVRVELYAEKISFGGGNSSAAGAAAAPDPVPAPAPTPPAAAGDKSATATPEAPAAATGTPVAPAPPRKKRPVATAPTLEPAPTLTPVPAPTPAPAEPVQKPARRSPRG